MKIRLGSNVPSAKSHDRIPNNQGMVESANQELDYLVDSVNQQYTNALAVDGVPFMLWRKRYEGHRCTCKNTTLPVNEPDSRLEEFNIQPTSEFKTVRVRSSWDRGNRQPNFHNRELGVDIGKVKADDGSDEQVITNFEDIDAAEIDDFLNGPVDPSLVQSGDNTTACGICFGTGFSNGYSLFRGQRLVFDTVNVKSVKGISVNNEMRPSTFEFTDSKGYVEWQVMLPRYIKSCVGATVRDNLQPTRGVLVEIKQGTNDWRPLSKTAVKEYEGKVVTIRVRRETVEAKHFTHVEIVVQFSEWDMTQVPQMSSGGGYSAPESVYSIELNLPPTITDMENGDVIFDFKYRRAWRITDTTDYKTATNKIFTWTASVRSLTSMDVLSLLKVSTEPSYSVGFGGLDYP